MKIYLRIFIVFIIIAFIQNQCIAQDSVARKGFISVNSGLFMPSNSHFNESYQSHFAFINGLTIGIPFMNKDFFFYGKVMYFQKSGIPLIYHFEYDPNTGGYIEHTTRDGDISLKQFLANIGIQYNLRLTSTNNLIFNGGISIVKATEKSGNPPDYDFYSDPKGIFGYFLGVGYEKMILDKFSMFTEMQYNFDWLILKVLDFKSGGANFNIGIRYCFNSN